MFSDFDKLFNEFEKMMFNPSYGKRRTYKGDDGLYYITTYYITIQNTIGLDSLIVMNLLY
jgi:hypothetical protein